MPNGMVSWLGGLFALGVMLLLSCIFSRYLDFSYETSFILGCLGFVGVVASIVVRKIQERAAEMRLLASKKTV